MNGRFSSDFGLTTTAECMFWRVLPLAYSPCNYELVILVIFLLHLKVYGDVGNFLTSNAFERSISLKYFREKHSSHALGALRSVFEISRSFVFVQQQNMMKNVFGL